MASTPTQAGAAAAVIGADRGEHADPHAHASKGRDGRHRRRTASPASTPGTAANTRASLPP
jgi:hypothetical protein